RRRLRGDAPRGLHVLRGLQRQRLGELTALGRLELPEQLLLLLDPLVLGFVGVDDRLRHQRIFGVRRIEEYAGERVVVLRGDRVVLVIVAAGAADGQAEEAARDDVDAIVTLVGT